MSKILICFFFFFSFVAQAETYPSKPQDQTRTYGNASWINFVSKDASCAAWNYVNYSATYSSAGNNCARHGAMEGTFSTLYSFQTIQTCPGGGTLSGTSCQNAPSCVAPAIRHPTSKICTTPLVCKSAETLTTTSTAWSCVAPTCTAPQINDAISGACITPYTDKPACVIPQSPITADCRFPSGPASAAPINCVDGSTVYVPMVCPINKWNPFSKPGPGQSATCANGSVVGYPDSCIKRYFDRVANPANLVNIGMLALGSGLPGSGLPRPTLQVIQNLETGLPQVRSILPIAAKINQVGTSAYASIDTSLPNITVGKAIAEYLKSTPGSTYSTALIAAASAGVAGMTLYQDSNTGQFIPVGTTQPLSDNELADIALRTNSQNPLPITQIEPYVQYDDIPWLEPAVDAIEGDFTRVYDPTGSQDSINFPNVSSGSPFIFPSFDSSQPSIATIDSASPTNYSRIDPDPTSLLPDPTSNTNPIGTDALTSPITNPDPTTLINPTSTELPPTPPTLYTDTWKYFDFLPMANPFVFDVHRFIPNLPEPTCYYEIHRTFHVPFLGNKHFDLAPCLPLQPLRAVLAWVFSVLTAFACFFVIFRS